MAAFSDRTDAGRQLANLVAERIERREDVVVLALPRGGVPVAKEVAERLSAPLELLVVRKLGTPLNPELAFGAISQGGGLFVNEPLVARLGITPAEISEVIAQEQSELLRRLEKYRVKQDLELTGKTVVLVDDGIATGATLKAALLALKTMRPARVIVAVPVAPNDAPAEFAELADEFICPLVTDELGSVGQWYERFDQVSDETVLSLFGGSPAASSINRDAF